MRRERVGRTVLRNYSNVKQRVSFRMLDEPWLWFKLGLYARFVKNGDWVLFINNAALILLEDLIIECFADFYCIIRVPVPLLPVTL